MNDSRSSRRRQGDATFAIARIVRCIVVVAVASLPLVARSSPKVAITYVAPADCPKRADVEAEIASYLASSKASSDVAATIRIDATASGVRVDVQTAIGATKGHRVLDAATCEEGVHAATLIVALAVDPLVVPAAMPPVPPVPPLPPLPPLPSVSASAAAPSPSPGPRPSPSPSPGPSPSPSPSPRPSPAPGSVSGLAPPSLSVAAGPALDTSPLPGVGFGVAAQVGIDLDRLRLATSFLALPSSKGGLDGRDAGGTFSLVAGGLASCVRVLGPVGPCAGFELGRMSANGFGVRNPVSQHVLWKAASVGAAASLWLGPVAIRPEAWIVFPIGMPDFVLVDLGLVHTPKIGVRTALLLEVKIF
jgi:hypothetical protein